MSVATKFPTTYEELAELGSGQHSFPASWEEYLDLLEKAEFNAEFDGNKITTMGYASFRHELLVSKLMELLKQIFNSSDYYVIGSGRPVHIEAKKVHMPDLHVGELNPQLVEYRKGLNAHAKPLLIVEVLSPSTENYDWVTKLPNYKTIPSVEYIIFVQQDTPFVSVFQRAEQQNIWKNIDLNELDQSFEINDKRIALKDIYQDIDFNKKQ